MCRTQRIEALLAQELNPVYLRVEDESGNHHVPKGAQTHFKVIAVSARFDGLKPIARHRLLNQLLSSEFEHGLHALSMHLFTQEEWDVNNQTVMKSPNCKDGYTQ